jgi:transposase-like protein
MTDHDFTHEPNLLDAQLAFEHWRVNRESARQPTPLRLKTLAVNLLVNHSRALVCKTININSTTLKDWINQAKAPSQFVTLPTEEHSPKQSQTHELKIVLPNGVHVHASHSYSATELLCAVSALAHHS